MNLTAWLRPYVERTAEPHAMSADDAAHDLLALALDGDTDAVSACRTKLRDSLTRDIKTQRQTGHATTLVAGKRRARVKTMPARPLIAADSGEQLGWTLTDLWAMSEPELSALLQRQLGERQSVTDRIAVTRRVLTCLRAHPDCTTAGQAWAADGRSTDEVDLTAGAA